MSMRWLSMSASFKRAASARRRPGVQQQQDRSVANIGCGRNQLLDFFRAEDDGKLLWHSGELHIVKLGIVPLENLLEKEMQRSHPVLDGSGRQFQIAQHVQLE